MNTPESLRARLSVKAMVTAEDQRDYDRDIQLFEVFDEWCREHTLVDLTTCGPRCPAYNRSTYPFTSDWCAELQAHPHHTGSGNAPTGQPCPVLVARQGNRCIYCHELAEDCECERGKA